VAVGYLLICLIFATPELASADDRLPVYDGIGADFSADSTLDRKVGLTDFRGRALLVFFGYTSCQDICPAALGHLTALMKRLGPIADRVQVLFVTVDPETDTPEHLRDYLSKFDDRFVGITGRPAEIAAIARSFAVQHASSHDTKVTTAHHRHKTYTDESFQYAHSQQIYLLDGKGRTRALFFTGSPLHEMETAIQSLVDSKIEEAQ
jgi:protein SCO1/2